MKLINPIKILLVVLLVLSVVGCRSGSKVRWGDGEVGVVNTSYKSPDYTKPKQVFEKNYSLGRTQETYIGNSIIKVKEYYVKEKHSYADATWTAEDDFVFYDMNGEDLARHKKGDIFKEKGMIRLDAINYYMLEDDKIVANGYSKIIYSILISQNGMIENRFLISYGDGGKAIAGKELEVVPKTASFSRVSGDVETVIIAEKGYINYELIYGGATNSEIKITYREYTPDGIARQAFYQNLVYSRGQQIIRFKNLKIQVHSVDNQRIVYTVLSDTEG